MPIKISIDDNKETIPDKRVGDIPNITEIEGFVYFFYQTQVY